MRSLTRYQLGVLVILIAVIGVIASFAVSAATTPSANIGSKTTDTDRGQTLVSTQAGGRISMFDGTGARLWTTSNDDTDYFEATMLQNDSVIVGFLAQGQQSCGQYESPCSRTGFRVIDPTPKPHITGEWSFPVRTKMNSEVHDVNLLPNSQFLITDMEHERIMTVAENGSITWQWNASQRYDAPPDPTKRDWLHINDVDRIGPGRYMVSVREANQILVVKRGQGVVDVINKDQAGSTGEECQREGDLADFNNDSNGSVHCGDPENIKQQHNPQYLGPDAVVVADSENDRVVELHNQSGNWTVAWSVNSANGLSFDWPRDANRLRNGNTLIADTRNNRVVEVAPNGTTVRSVRTDVWPYSADRLPAGSQENASSLPRYGEWLNDSSLPRMEATGASANVAGSRSSIPLLTPAYNGLSYAFPLPIWFQPWHVGVIAAGVVLLAAGAILIRQGRQG